jgi:hypothetical protein
LIVARKAEAAAEIERQAVRLEDARRGIGSTGGLALIVALRNLMDRHGLAHANPPPLPLSSPIDAPSIRIRAVGATTDLDLSRSRFSPMCKWPALDPSRIRLLVSHDETRVAGKIEEIAFDAMGRMIVVATVTDRAAMMLPALSISAAIGKFTIVNAASPSLLYADIEEVTDISEFSLSTTPANLACRILERWIPTPYELSSEALMARVKAFQATVAALQASSAFARAA